MSLLSISAQPTDNVSENPSNRAQRFSTYGKYKVTYSIHQKYHSDTPFLNKGKDAFMCQCDVSYKTYRVHLIKGKSLMSKNVTFIDLE